MYYQLEPKNHHNEVHKGKTFETHIKIGKAVPSPFCQSVPKHPRFRCPRSFIGQINVQKKWNFQFMC